MATTVGDSDLVPSRYDPVARTFHWVLAALILANIVIGIWHDSVFRGWMGLHKSIGMTVLVLSIARLAWRLGHKPDPLPASLPQWQHVLAGLTHAIFYIFMIAVPLTGWIFTSPGKYPTTWFGLFTVPPLPFSKGDAIVGLSHQGHVYMGWAWGALAIVHIGAALAHHFVWKDGVLRRMA